MKEENACRDGKVQMNNQIITILSEIKYEKPVISKKFLLAI